ncbi:sugar phosphate isomerase/epimerase family protein [Subtercola lobariae]|uniref:Xylose isomerase-like TIM barrel domain-containing protein n=1 Tax=Subtercola lobariae TaxID=1588641 RepID=A0A917B7W4_9MICO|nr:sugar phosphate isomerase/epimerase [Subtercola lobariae]GGF29043.1 hypothetical protein GCM10011399_22690 [Subtercola lobariae]
MPLNPDRVALNPLQWISIKDADGVDHWRYAEPDFREAYPQVLTAVRQSGFEAVMMEVLATQTLRDYEQLVADARLVVSPGYASIGLPEEHDVSFAPGSAEESRWFDGVRRKAEESNYFGQSTIFLAPEVWWSPNMVRTGERVAVGADYREDRLDRVIDLLGRSAEILAAEGVRAGLHNHVGTWVETEAEIERVLDAIPASLLGASFDIGHLTWAGVDAVAMITRHADRLVDLHFKDLDLDVAAASRAEPTSYNEATDRGIFLEPGSGGIDLDAVIDALPAGWPGWLIVEVDRTAIDPADSAAICWNWVSARFATE